MQFSGVVFSVLKIGQCQAVFMFQFFQRALYITYMRCHSFRYHAGGKFELFKPTQFSQQLSDIFAHNLPNKKQVLRCHS